MKKTGHMGRPREGRVKTIVSFEPEQLEQLREEAAARAPEGHRPDVGALIRWIVARWLKRRRR